MTFGGRPSIVRYGLLCMALAGVLSVEISLTCYAKTDIGHYALKMKNVEGEIHALGPLAATKEALEECESSFGDSFTNGQTISGSTLSGKARMTMELARVFGESGLEEGAASTAASSLANSPEATLAATCMAKTEGVRLRNVATHVGESETTWTIDATCAEKSLSELLSTLGRNSSGIALDALDMRGNGNAIDLRIELVLPKETGVAR